MWLHGFGMILSSSNSSIYYVIDCSANKVYIWNDNWLYISFKRFTAPAYMITIGTSLYMTGNSNVWKLDEHLNTLIQYNSNGIFSYRGLCYN